MLKVSVKLHWEWIARGLGGLVNIITQSQKLYGKMPESTRKSLEEQVSKLQEILRKDTELPDA